MIDVSSWMAGRPRPVQIAQPLETAIGVATTPQPHRRQTHPHQPADLGVAVPLRGQQQDPGSLRQARRNRRCSRPLPQDLLVPGPQHQQLYSRHEPLFQTTTRKSFPTRDTRARLVRVSLLMTMLSQLLCRRNQVPSREGDSVTQDHDEVARREPNECRPREWAGHCDHQHPTPSLTATRSRSCAH
jgi:hypothetical protein